MTTEQEAFLRNMWGTVLWEAAEREPDPEQKSMLRKAAAYMAGIPRDVAVGILIAMGSHRAGS
jgi:hypothetical protein